ncbi:50S ribosomal protein L20 [Feifania hominis]|uniref:Large ribosomal subunit protein bL20 n=1 Tax=Feifania hominis TaxID=2763660 RepID=A0A926DCC0_9FIRM|nr:50S ribosomal protein L20 [Feifania hominis]MBC8535209.1 50S ribosomal protein L20 [Feifania hominis]
MARVKGAMMTRKRRKKVLKLAKGYYGGKSRLFKTANQAVMKSLQYAYIGRKQKKREFRNLWITRISAGCKMNNTNYSTFMHGLKVAGIDLNRKVLADLAHSDPAGFASLVKTSLTALGK